MRDDVKLLGAMVVKVTDQNFQTAVLEEKGPVLVDFWAEWCGPCRMAAPILDELSGEYEGRVKIAKLNVDENQETSMKYGVMSIPTVILFKDGKEAGRQVGFGGKAMYEKLVKSVVVN